MARYKITETIAMVYAVQAANHSPAPKRKVGCVFWRKDGIIATATNSQVPGTPTCADRGCHDIDGQCRRNEHSETMALALCARDGKSTNGIYVCVTEQPCIECARRLAIAGVREVYYLNESDYYLRYDEADKALFQMVGLKSMKIEIQRDRFFVDMQASGLDPRGMVDVQRVMKGG